MLKKYLLIFLLFTYSGIWAQTFEIGSNSLVGSNNQLPFWLWANKLGKYTPENSSSQNLSFVAYHKYTPSKSSFSVEAGTDVNFQLANSNNIWINEFYTGLNWNIFELKVGAFAEKEIYGGLSTSNGNLSASRNARPHPRIRIGFNRYVPILKNKFSLYGFYEEGLLYDERYVTDTHLHRKGLYLRFGSPAALEFTCGFEHFVMWGGTHPYYGELQGWESYIDYVSANGGNDESLDTDKKNIMGNGYGSWQFQFRKTWEKINTIIYISHPYDDRSGIRFQNYRDNLIGLFIDVKKENPVIDNIVLEYFYTKHQSGPAHGRLEPDGTWIAYQQGQDDYYNHGIYASGATYFQMSMASPLFAPVVINNGISGGFENTRFSGFHIGAKGFLSQELCWKGMLTYSNNFGRYISEGVTSYNPSRKQLTSMAELLWSSASIPLKIGFTLAADHGSLFDKSETTSRLGGMLAFTYSL